MDELDLVECLVRILTAALCGGVLGWEREASNKPAGLRTNMLVSIGAATVTLAALDLHAAIVAESQQKVTADPIRIVSGVIGGLGFLGAGAIIQSGGRVQGMTTAATIWVVGGIGVACGIGNFTVALISVTTTFFVLYAIGGFERSQAAPEALQKGDADANDRPPEPDGSSQT